MARLSFVSARLAAALLSALVMGQAVVAPVAARPASAQPSHAQSSEATDSAVLPAAAQAATERGAVTGSTTAPTSAPVAAAPAATPSSPEPSSSPAPTPAATATPLATPAATSTPIPSPTASLPTDPPASESTGPTALPSLDPANLHGPSTGGEGVDSGSSVTSGPPSAPGPIDLDSASDTGPIVPLVQTTRLRPVADAYKNGSLAYVPSGTTAWNLIDEVALDGSDYVYVPGGQTSQYVAQFAAANLSASDIVTGITFDQQGYQDCCAGGFVVRNPATGTLYQILPNRTSSTITIKSRPWDGRAWTPADVNNLQYGFDIGAAGNWTLTRLYADVQYVHFAQYAEPVGTKTRTISSVALPSFIWTPITTPFGLTADGRVSVTIGYTLSQPSAPAVHLRCDGNDVNGTEFGLPGSDQTAAVFSFGPYASSFTNCIIEIRPYGFTGSVTGGSYTFDDGLAGSRHGAVIGSQAVATNAAPGVPVTATFNIAINTQSVFALNYTTSAQPSQTLVCGGVQQTTATSAAGTNTTVTRTYGPAASPLTNCTWNAVSVGGATTVNWGSVSWDDGVTAYDPLLAPSLFDNVTRDDTPSFSGTTDPTATQVDLYDGATLVGSDTTVASGTWNITTTVRPEGIHALTAIAVNASGSSPASPALSVTIDTSAPATPSTPDLATAADDGSSSADNITTIATPMTPNVSGNLTTGTFDANGRTFLSPKIYSNAADTPYVNWTLSYSGYTGRMSTGLTCNYDTDPHDDNTSSGLSHSIAWPIQATVWCQVYAWANGGGTYTVTGGAYAYHASTAPGTLSFSGTGSGDAASYLLLDGANVVGHQDPWVPMGASYVTVPDAPFSLGTRTLTVRSYDVAGNPSSPSNGLAVEFAASSRLLVASVAPTTNVAAATVVTTSVLNEARQPASAWSGTITIATDDPGAVYPDGATYAIPLGSLESGHAFRVLFKNAGNHTITVSSPGVTSATTTVAVDSTALQLTAPATVFQNAPFLLTTKVRTSTGLPVPGYAALATYTSSDSTAVFNGAVNGNQYQFTCGCDDGKSFAVSLGTLGQQTITVTDQFGITKTITVTVVAGSPGAPDPVTQVQMVQWHHGNTVDYYVKIAPNSPALTFVAANDYCPATGASFWSQESISVPVPATGVSPQYTQFSVRVGADMPVGGCWLNGTGITMHRLIYTDGTNTWITPGQLPPSSTDRYTNLAENNLYTMLDAGDPFLGPNSIAVIERGDPFGLGFNDEVGFNVPLGLHLRVTVDEPVRIFSVGYNNGATGDNNGAGGTAGGAPRGERQFASFSAPGAYDVYFDDVPWGCYFTARDLQSFRYAYSGNDGRVGQYTIGLGVMNNAYAFDNHCPNSPENATPTNAFDFSLDWGKSPVFDNIKRFLDNDPVEAFSGTLVQQVTDFSLGGLSPSLHLYRTYRSDIADGQSVAMGKIVGANRLFGVGWASDLDQALQLPLTSNRDDPGTIQARGADGGQYTWRKDTSGVWRAGLQKSLTLTQTGGGWTIADEGGAGTRYDATGRLVAEFDGRGRELSLGYDGAGHLVSITDATNRIANVTTNAAGQITRIDLPGGRHVDYSYASGILASATDLAGTTLTYVTDIRGRLTAIKDAGSHTLLANTYDSRGRVVAQTDANGNPSYWSYDDKSHVTQVIGARGGVQTDCFSNTGAPIAQIDQLGGRQTWGYNAQGDVVRSTDALGNTSSAKYDAKHHMTSATDPLGRTVTTSWDPSGQPAVMSGVDGTTTTSFDPATHLPLTVTKSDATHALVIAQYTYDPSTKQVATTTDANNGVTQYHYDAYGYVDSLIDPMNRKTTFVTDANTGFLTSTVDALGNASGGIPGDHRSTYAYDDMGRVLTATDPIGNMAGGTPADHRTTYTYDSLGRLKTTSRASGALTTNFYDLAGQLTSTVVKLTAGLNATTTYEYDAEGHLAATTDPENGRTEMTYDLAGRAATVKDARLKTTQLFRDALGQVTKVIDPTGVISQTAYDAGGRVTKTTDAALKDTIYTYDPTFGTIQTITDPLQHTTQYFYDWLGRQSSVKNAKLETSSVVYDNVGNVLTATNNRQKTTTFTWNLDNQLATVSEPGDTGALLTVYAYDAGGRVQTRTNARTAVERLDYDALGRPTTFTDAANRPWQTFYTNDGQVDHTIDGIGRTTQFAYDLAGRLTTITPATPTTAISYGYDKTGRVLTMTDGNGQTTYGYDPDGDVTSVLRGGRTTTYTYDDAGRSKTVVYPASVGTVTYGYDTAGRLSTISDWATRVTTNHYDNASRVSSVDRPGGLTTTYTYDELNRPLSATSVRSSTTLLTQGWTYDPNGNIATLSDDTGQATFTYDNLDRLKTASYPGAQSYSYTYDAVGNTLTAATPAGTTTFTYDLADRITSTGPTNGPGIPGSSTKPPTTNTAGWTTPANAYASDNLYATASPAKNATISTRLGGFDFSAIPANATITGVTVTVEWKVSTTASDATLGSQLYVNSAARGTELVNAAEPVTDTTQTYAVTGLTRADLLNNLQVQVRATRGKTGNTAFTGSLDAVSVAVTWTTPPVAAAPTYDLNGNMLTDGSYGGRTYTYDTLGRLLTVAGGGSTTTYSLDGAGNRWSQATGAMTTNFDLDVTNPTPTILFDGTRKYLPDVPGAGYDSGGTWQNALTDLIGSPIRFVSQTGTTTTPVHYDPYGAPRPGSTASTGIGYAGEYRDGTGLVNLRFRSYDPVLGRFIGRDTFGGVASAPQTGNRYSYATSNPLRYTDPSGHFVNAAIAVAPTLIETAMMFNPVGAALILGYEAITGTDPATGQRVPPGEILVNAALVFGPIAAAKAIGKVAEMFSAARAASSAGRDLRGIVALAREEGGIARAGAEVLAGGRGASELSVSARTAEETRSALSEVRGASNGGRPSWLSSEKSAHEELQSLGFQSQKSFLNGREVSYGTSGSVRPDEYSSLYNMAVDVKNYSVETAAGRGKLVSNVLGQARERAIHLPAGTRQGLIIDIRGQTVDQRLLDAMVGRIARRSNGAISIDDIILLR